MKHSPRFQKNLIFLRHYGKNIIVLLLLLYNVVVYVNIIIAASVVVFTVIDVICYHLISLLSTLLILINYHNMLHAYVVF